jgi:hypothetical protein
MTNYNQRVIITDVSGNVIVPSSPGGQQASSSSTSVVIASDQSPVPVTLAAEASIKIGTIDIDQTTPGTTNGVQINAALPAGANIVGSLLGRTSAPSVTPTVTASSAYSAGNVVGGLLSFANAVDAALSGVLQRVTLNCKSVQTAGFKLYIFSANPSASTFTDKTAPAIAAADIGKLVDIISLGFPDSGLGTHTLYVSDCVGDALVLAASSLSAVLVTTGTPTFAGSSDISVSLGILKD